MKNIFLSIVFCFFANFIVAQNVGINDSVPSAKLSVKGAETTPDGQAASIKLQNTAPGITNAWFLRAGATGNNTPNGGFSIADNTGYRFNITNTGNIGIGTTMPLEQVTLQSGNISLLSSPKGILLNGFDGPMINRGFDPFTAGSYTGLGRWGLFMEPNNLTIGLPALPFKAFAISTYNSNSTINKQLLRVSADAATNALVEVNGAMKIEGSNTIEFGAGIAGKELNAGKIGYDSFGPQGLSIVGSGTTALNRKVYIFAEGGTTFNGQVRILGGAPAAGKVLTSDATGLASWQTLSLLSNNPNVSICCQSWMTKNLDVDTYRNGDLIPQVTDQATWAALTTGAWCYYNNSAANNATYGKLYNWYAVNDPRGLAPEGWHIPTDFEWTTLENCLGGAAVAGGALKEIGTTLWLTPNAGATNISGWKGLPGGFRNVTSFFNVTIIGSWWSSTETSAASAYVRGIDNSNGDISRSINSKTSGNAVRCIRD